MVRSFAAALTAILALASLAVAAPPPLAVGPTLPATLTLATCLALVEEASLPARMSMLDLEIERQAYARTANDFNTGFTAGWSTSSLEFGGSSVDSTIFGTRQDAERTTMRFDQPLDSGGSLGLAYDQGKTDTNSSFGLPTTWSSAIRLSWEQPLFKGAGTLASWYAERSARIRLEEQRLATEDVLVEERLGAIMDFLECFRRQEARTIQERSLETARALHHLSRARLAAGLAARLDVLESELRVTEAEAALTRAGSDLSVARSTLALRLAAEPSQATTVVCVIPFLPDAPPEGPAIQTALARRRDVARRHLELRRRELDLQALANGDRPDLRLTSSVSRSGEGGSRDEGSRLDNTGYSVGITYTTRFGRRDETTDLEAGRSLLARARLDLARLRDEVAHDVRVRLTRLRDAEVQVRLGRLQQRLAEERFAFTRAAYENSLRSMLDVVQAEEAMTAKRSACVTLVVDHFRARAELLRALGSHLTIEQATEGGPL